MQVEVCASSPASARAAQDGGADRIELCSELAVGGITPSPGFLEWTRENIRLPVHVLIRPRSGNFQYSEEEFSMVLADIAHCREMGFAGIVSGCLLPDGSVDRERTARLRDAVTGHFTFHRAFDQCPHPEAALEVLDAIGVDTILSSGQARTAVEGLPLLERLRNTARHCSLMPGGGIRASNVLRFAAAGFDAVHLSATGGFTPEKALHGPSMNTPGLLTEGPPPVTDASRVREVVSLLESAPGRPGLA